MGIHSRFFEQPRDRSQFEVNRDFRGIIGNAFDVADVCVYERLFETREQGVTLIPVEDESKIFDFDAVEWEWYRYYREKYGDDIPPGFTSA